LVVACKEEHNKNIKKNASSFKKKKPYFWGREMRFAQNKWWVISDGDWLEFSGKESEINWK
jgi:hypothetical protein